MPPTFLAVTMILATVFLLAGVLALALKPVGFLFLILVDSVFGDGMMHYKPWLGLGLSLLFHPGWHQGLTVGEVHSLYVDVSAGCSFLEISSDF